MKKTLLDSAVEAKRGKFLTEWKPFDEINKRVERAILNHFRGGRYMFQTTHDPASKKPFRPTTFSQIEEALGLPYTSTSSYAALWVCNGGYLWADDTHYFIGFAVNEAGDIYGIADDENENSIYILIK